MRKTLCLLVLATLAMALTACGTVYDKDSPAVKKVDAMIDDFGEIVATADAITAALDGIEGLPVSVQDDLDWIHDLGAVDQRVADSLRNDLLGIEPGAEEPSADVPEEPSGQGGGD